MHFLYKSWVSQQQWPICALEQDLVRTFHPPAEDPVARQHQPGQGAELSLLHLLSLLHITEAQLSLLRGNG